MIQIIFYQYKNFIFYIIIGVSGIVLDFIIFYILTTKFLLFYQYANFISVSAGISNNFLWNALVNFKVKDKIIKRFLSFYIVGLIGLGISALFLYLLIDIIRQPVFLAKASVIIIVPIIQYILNKTISFRKTENI